MLNEHSLLQIQIFSCESKHIIYAFSNQGNKKSTEQEKRKPNQQV